MFSAFLLSLILSSTVQDISIGVLSIMEIFTTLSILVDKLQAQVFKITHLASC
jgi:hypothetical protein